MRLLVCGGRDFNDAVSLFHTLDLLHANSPVTLLINGYARGADELAAQWARSLKIPLLLFPAKWDDMKAKVVIPAERIGGDGKPRIYNKAAGTIRNQLMLDEGKPDVVVAFPGGPGTADMIRRAKAAGVRVLIIPPRRK